MKTIIYGNREHWHIAAAHKALDMHQTNYYYVDKPRIYTVIYRGKKTLVEVVNRKCSVVANVMAGHRKLKRVRG